MIEPLKESSDCILSIRDSLGIGLKKVFIVTRTWTGGEPGDGDAHDVVEELLYTPHTVDLSLNFRALEGGTIKQGDLLLKGVSKNKNPDRASFEATTSNRGVEKFFLIGDRLYICISIRERYLTWDIQVRPLSDQTRYGE